MRPAADRTEEPLIVGEEVFLGDCPAWAVAVSPFDVAQPSERVAQDDGLRLVEQARPAARLNRDAEGGELLDQPGIGGAAADQHSDVTEPDSLVGEIKD